MYRIVIYGYAIPVDRLMGKGSGTLVDMTYYSDEPISVQEIRAAIEQADFFMVAAKDENGHIVQDRVIVDEIKIGIDQVYQ